jgi:hypothetical protein
MGAAAWRGAHAIISVFDFKANSFRGRVCAGASSKV